MSLSVKTNEGIFSVEKEPLMLIFPNMDSLKKHIENLQGMYDFHYEKGDIGLRKYLCYDHSYMNEAQAEEFMKLPNFLEKPIEQIAKELSKPLIRNVYHNKEEEK